MAWWSVKAQGQLYLTFSYSAITIIYLSHLLIL